MAALPLGSQEAGRRFLNHGRTSGASQILNVEPGTGGAEANQQTPHGEAESGFGHDDVGELGEDDGLRSNTSAKSKATFGGNR